MLKLKQYKFPKMGIFTRIFILFILFITTAWAIPAEEFQFQSLEDKAAFTALLKQLRCVVCQNQSLADSNAPLASDLRKEIYQQWHTGARKEEIISFLVSRYGEFVLYEPRLKGTTWVLWFGPIFVFCVAFIILIQFIRNQNRLVKKSQ